MHSTPWTGTTTSPGPPGCAARLGLAPAPASGHREAPRTGTGSRGCAEPLAPGSAPAPGHRGCAAPPGLPGNAAPPGPTPVPAARNAQPRCTEPPSVQTGPPQRRTPPVPPRSRRVPELNPPVPYSRPGFPAAPPLPVQSGPGVAPGGGGAVSIPARPGRAIVGRRRRRLLLLSAAGEEPGRSRRLPRCRSDPGKPERRPPGAAVPEHRESSRDGEHRDFPPPGLTGERAAHGGIPPGHPGPSAGTPGERGTLGRHPPPRGCGLGAQGRPPGRGCGPPDPRG